MGNETRLAAIALLIGAAACGGGGGGGSSGSGNTVASAFGVVNLVSHAPEDNAVQVDLDAIINLEFDADMALEAFGDEDTWLRSVGSSTNIPVTFSRGSTGRVTCQPNSELQAETDYVFQLSALTSD
ncbi:MAG: hypothetical protein ACI9S9_000811, partial [Planctomycetota bacterium]